MSLPTEKEVDNALAYLVETDRSFANLKASMSALEYGIKIAEALGVMEAEGAQALRQAASRSSQRYLDAVNSYKEAKAEFHYIENKRNRAITVIDVWRSVNANQRRS